jgi:hypothetical protein
MIQRVLYVSLWLGLLALSGRAEPTSDLWILSGQSNACGRAKLPGPEPNPHVRVYVLETDKFVDAQDPLPGMNTKGMGPWVVAAQEVARTGVDLRLVGFAMGGRPISYWHVGQPGDQGLMPRIAKAGQKASVFLWYQGESDARRDMTIAGYVSELQDLVGRVRKQSNNPDLLAVIVQLGAYTTPGTSGFTSIREAQRRFVAQDGKAVLVPALGRTLGDTVHMDNAANRELGAEIARALLKVRYQQADVDWPGPVLDAATVGSDNKPTKRVVAHFAEVNQLRGAAPGDFAVLDGEGTNRCTGVKPGKTVVTLDFERDILLPARLVYGFGQNPRATLMDEAGNRAPAVQVRIHAGNGPEDRPTTAPNGAGRVD